MNVKAFAAIVGTLSLGALATGCASNKAAEGSGTTESAGAQAACGGDKSATGTSASCSGDKAAPTEQKGDQGACGEKGCAEKK